MSENHGQGPAGMIVAGLVNAAFASLLSGLALRILACRSVLRQFASFFAL
jgi:hypothetical protein